MPVLTYELETMAITRKFANKLQTIQRAMERAMIGITLRDRIRNEEIRRRTKVTDVLSLVAQLKWRWGGLVARQDDHRWAHRILVWRPRETKRSIGRPQKRWRDDIQNVAGRNWTWTARNRKAWRDLEEAYIQEWISRG